METETYYILRRIVKRHDGNVEVSVPGRGFSIEDCEENAINSCELREADKRVDGKVSYEIYEVPPTGKLVKEISAEEAIKIRKEKKVKGEKEAQSADEEQ